MKRGKTFKISTALLFAALPLIVIIVVGLQAYKRKIPALITSEAKVQNNIWATYNYTSLEENIITNQIKNIVNSNSNSSSLTDDQKTLLALEIKCFMQAYSQGTYKAYKTFRMPSGIPFTWNTDRKSVV